VLVERGREVSYAVGGLASCLSGEAASAAALDRERAEFFRDVHRVEVLTGTSVEAIDWRRRRVRVGGEDLAYTALIHALGAESVVPDVPGLWPAANACHFRTLGDLERVVGALDRPGRRVAVLGGGFFGVEAVDGLLRRGGADVTLLERGPRLLPLFGESSSRRAEADWWRPGRGC
jgi:NADPH-dependent 2,4-dienoyl-CoA reductase/sulfur reductase-like enzyme